MRNALEEHPGEYGNLRFKRVQMWGDWAAEQGATKTDTGIDLVGEEHSGRLCAVQCKFYATNHKLTQPDIDPFIAASATDEFQSRILIFTGESLNKNAQARIDKTAEPQIELISRNNLAVWPIADWRVLVENPEALTFLSSPRAKQRPYQADAVKAIVDGFDEADKGKLVLPCGTGKTLVHLWAAEELAGEGASVLYVMPSLSLMAQTMREWANNRSIGHSYIAVCSDTSVGKRVDKSGSLDELPAPATTKPEKVGELMAAMPADRMNVVFSSYQSLQVIADAQANHGLGKFDFVVCDEAHRTTGLEDYEKATSDKSGLSGFRLIHSPFAIERERILFSTATPRVYTSGMKEKVSVANAKEGEGRYGIFSMDNENVYGKELYRMKFAEAIRDRWLAEYQVIAVGVREDDPYIRQALKVVAEEAEGAVDASGKKYKANTYFGLQPEAVVKLLGCWDALADPRTKGMAGNENRVVGTLEGTGLHASKAIAFCNTIATSQGLSEVMKRAIRGVREHSQVTDAQRDNLLALEVKHIDGSMSSLNRANELEWLREPDKAPNEARLLSNARCLTEGVDVPDLDAVLFLEPKQSYIDIVQAVGRVMRQPHGAEQKTGYIVLPILIPEGKTMEDTLGDKNVWGKVWTVLNALKSHDERIEAWVDSADITEHDGTSQKAPFVAIDPGANPDDLVPGTHSIQGQLALSAADAIASQIVLTCGSKQWWPEWGDEAKEILVGAERLLATQIGEIPASQEAFDSYYEEMRKTLSTDLTKKAALEMLAQHIVTYPVFEALTEENASNPIAVALEAAIAKILEQPEWRTQGVMPHLLAPLNLFYAGVRQRAQISNTPDSKSKLLLDIYDSFFASAMPKTQAQLGVVYTPVWIVDFILRSADAACRQEFSHGLTSKNVRVLDPFTGTGTFISRLLTTEASNGQPLIKTKDVEHKYHHDLHAVELVPLAYHIASLKIAEAYGERTGQQHDALFQNIILADTFKLSRTQQQLFENDGLEQNDERKATQQRVNITLVASNPPWSAGEKSATEDRADKTQEQIAERVRETYGARHKQVTGRGGGKALGNLYIQSLRWATDRLSNGKEAPDLPRGEDQFVPQLGKGIVAFVHPNSLATATSLAGARACMRDEFSKIYVINLRGDAYKSGEEWQREGDKLFEGGSRNGVQITICVSNPDAPVDAATGNKLPADLFYAEVPESSSVDKKQEWLEWIRDVCSPEMKLVPVNERHDWVNLTDGSFDRMLEICTTDKKRSRVGVGVATTSHTLGVITSCDVYAYASSYTELADKMRRLINHYEETRDHLHPDGTTISYSKNDQAITEATKHTPYTLENIKWTEPLKKSLRHNLPLTFDESKIREVLYRPFQKMWLYEDEHILSAVKSVSRLFPREPATGITRERERERESNPLRQAPTTELLNHSNEHHPRPLLRRGSHQSNTKEKSLLVNAAGVSLGVMATRTMPDLGTVKGSHGSTRAIPKQVVL